MVFRLVLDGFGEREGTVIGVDEVGGLVLYRVLKLALDLVVLSL
jgi:hypothetical protein